ncbi:MAG: metallopeptidase family protein [Candidatus Nealsonbacteria bacterium]|nr:metallopeptidase family protein [Candidatus Nealsonbacteria bacterium]
MELEKFEKLVNEGIRAIPEKILKKLENVDVVIEDEPAVYQLRKIKLKRDSVLFGLYEGVPQNKRWGYGQALPDKISIFKKAIENYARSEEEIKEIVMNTVWHEIAHHFGMDEEMVRESERKRRKK